MALEHTEKARLFYNSTRWRKLRKTFLNYHNYVCNRCKGEATLVHHIEYITMDNIDDSDITLGWDNLEPLCDECHKREHNGNEEKVYYGYTTDGDYVQIRKDDWKYVRRDKKTKILFIERND